MGSSGAAHPPLALLRSNDICFLGIARGSAAAASPVRPICFDWPGAGPWYSERSRVLSEPARIENPFQQPEQAARQLAEILARWGAESGQRPLLLGSSDANLMFMLEHQPQLAPLTRNMGPVDFGALRGEVIRKDECAEVLRSGDVPLPQTFALDRLDQIPRIVEEVRLPCLYKPAEKDTGQTFYARHGGLKAVEVDSRDSLASHLQEELQQGFRLIVQEKILFGGPHEEIPFYLYADAKHEIRMAATAIKETIQPHPFGTATVLRLSHHPELLVHAQQVVRALRWRGILMIEFIRDQRDETWKVIEVNPRPWLFVDFFRRSGLNYLGHLHDDLEGRTSHWPKLATPGPDTLEASPVHISLPTAIEPLLSAKERPRVEDVVTFLRGIEGRRSLTYLAPDDPEPGIAELADLAERWGFDERVLLAAVQRELGGD